MDDVIKAREEQRGWSDIAADYGVSRVTLERALAEYPDFPEELKRPIRRSEKRVGTSELREMIEDEKLSDQEIAQRLGMRKDSFMKFRRRRGFYRREPGDHDPKTQEELALAESLLDAGWSFHMITEETKMSYDTLNRHFPGRGFTREQTIEAALMAKRLESIAA